MDLSGRTTIQAPRARVWAFLSDLDAMSGCTPDPGTIERVDDRHARIRATVGSGFLASELAVDLQLESLEPPDRVTIAATGQAAGTRLVGRVQVALGGPPEGPTTLDWQAHVDLSGTFAAMGERMVEGSGRPLIERALDCVRSKVESPAAA